MKIAMPVDEKKLDSPICPSFGRTELFLFYDTDTNTEEYFDNSAIASEGGAGIKAAQALADNGIEVVLTPRCGENAVEVLDGADIKLYKTMNGTARENIEEFKDGKLSLLTDIHKGFHNHGN